jgi:GTP pyrophosphokinase
MTRTILTTRFDQAPQFASHAHAGHLRKGTDIPYVSHLLIVAGLILEYGGDEDAAIAGLLHDAIEDTHVTRHDIAARFGDAVAGIVDGCTDADVKPKPEWRIRKEQYIAHLSTVSPPTLLVSAADKLANVRSILKDYRIHGESLWSRFNGGRDGTLWYYRALADEFMKLEPRQIAEDLDAEVSRLEHLAST